MKILAQQVLKTQVLKCGFLLLNLIILWNTHKPLCGLWDTPWFTPHKHCITSIYQLVCPNKITMVFTTQHSKTKSLLTFSALAFFDLRDIW